MSSVPSSTAAVGYLQQFIQFPRSSVPRTILYCAVANCIIYQLAFQLVHYFEEKKMFPTIHGRSIGILAIGGVTTLLNLVQFKLFNYQLGKIYSVFLGAAFVALSILFYDKYLREHSPERQLYSVARELITSNRDRLDQIALGIEGVTAILFALKNNGLMLVHPTNLIDRLDQCFSRQLLPVLSFPQGKDQILLHIADLINTRNDVPNTQQGALDHFDQIFTEVIDNPPKELRHLIVPANPETLIATQTSPEKV